MFSISASKDAMSSAISDAHAILLNEKPPPESLKPNTSFTYLHIADLKS